MAFQPTDKQLRAAETLLLAMTHEQIIEPIVKGYEREILARHQFHIDQKWVGRRGTVDRVILDPNEAYLLNEADAKIFYEECYEARDAAGLYVEKPEHCPYCVAHHMRVQAEGAMMEAMAETPGLEHLRRVMQAKLELRDKAVDLTLRMLTPFVADSLAKKFIKCEESSVGLLHSFGVMTGQYDAARGGVEATIPMGALERIAACGIEFRLEPVPVSTKDSGAKTSPTPSLKSGDDHEAAPGM